MHFLFNISLCVFDEKRLQLKSNQDPKQCGKYNTIALVEDKASSFFRPIHHIIATNYLLYAHFQKYDFSKKTAFFYFINNNSVNMAFHIVSLSIYTRYKKKMPPMSNN